MKSKYNVEMSDKSKRTEDGITFDSALEARYYREVIKKGIQEGNIISYELQKKYELQPAFKYKNKTIRAITYTADFVVTYKDGHTEVIDTKGFPDQKAVMKKKMFLYKYPDITYKWIAYSKTDGGFIDYDELKKKRAARKKHKQNLT